MKSAFLNLRVMIMFVAIICLFVTTLEEPELRYVCGVFILIGSAGI